jgi:hypothetical protein
LVKWVAAKRLRGVRCECSVGHCPHPRPLPHALTFVRKCRLLARAGEGGSDSAKGRLLVFHAGPHPEYRARGNGVRRDGG